MIEVSQLHKSFGQQQVLRGVDLQIDEGESVVIIGGSGCGKSVLLRHIIGLVQPDEGDVKIDGQSIADLSERELIKVRRKFGMLFQGSALFDSLTVEENVGFLLEREQKMSLAAIRETVADALELVGVGLLPDEVLVPTSAMCHQCREVALGSARDEHGSFFAEGFRYEGFQSIHGGVVVEDVVAQFGFRHGFEHGGGRARYGVAAEVDHWHGANASERGERPKA